ncbi:MAG: hypothetical protein WKF47_18910 [Geodermatophilaceae bacterium]
MRVHTVSSAARRPAAEQSAISGQFLAGDNTTPRERVQFGRLGAAAGPDVLDVDAERGGAYRDDRQLLPM